MLFRSRFPHRGLRGRRASGAFEKLASHVAANGVNLYVAWLSLGVASASGPGRDRFIDGPAADALRPCEYRRGFEVGESHEA